MRVVLLAVVFLAMGCFTAVTDPNHWNIPFGQFPRFSTDSDVCRHQASHPLQPDLPNADELDQEVYRSCMENSGWTERD